MGTLQVTLPETLPETLMEYAIETDSSFVNGHLVTQMRYVPPHTELPSLREELAAFALVSLQFVCYYAWGDFVRYGVLVLVHQSTADGRAWRTSCTPLSAPV